MQHFDYKPHGVCPMNISFDLDGDTVHNVSFKGGCNGNLQAISRVVEGMTVEQIEGYFKGISCNGRGTSCSSGGACVYAFGLSSNISENEMFKILHN